ncbi:hypothetical protein [Pseudomonas nitroreducens]|uniref:hypothetical protein n=1 Tax=Pseudomonas nitroreducens TaxID=46680 RepID=UPI003D2BF17B
MNYREQFYEGEIDGKTLLDVIDEKEAEAQALREEVIAANDRADTLVHRMMGMVTRHFADAWRNRDTTKELDGYLSAGIAELERERNAALAEIEALRARVVVVPDNLLERCREILEWQETGIIKGDALRSYCQSKIWGRDPSALRMGEGETAQEAYRFIDELARLNGKAVSEGLLRRILERLRKAQIFDLSSELSELLGEGKEP